MQDFHYYATCALGWALGDTRDEAITRLVERFRSDFKAMTAGQHKQGEPGAYVWSCRVNAPRDASYRIEFYTPKGVETFEHMESFVTYVTQKNVAYWNNTATLSDPFNEDCDAVEEELA